MITRNRYRIRFVCYLFAICTATFSLHAQLQHQWKSLRRFPGRTMQEACGTSPDGRRAASVGYFGSVYLTSDRGVSWSFVQIDEAQTLRSVAYFSDSGLVIAGGWGAVYRSDDHFRTWERVVVDENDDITCVRHLDARILLCTGISGAVHRSSDAGQTWTKVHSSTAPLHAISTAPQGRAMAVGGKGSTLITADSGRTWLPTTIQAPDTVTLLAVAWVDDSTWMIGGDTTYFARSSDDGGTWETKVPAQSLIDERYNVRTIRFTSNGIGVAIVYNMFRPFGRFCITVDGGKKWREGINGVILNTDVMTMEDLAFFPKSDTGVISGVFDRVSTMQITTDPIAPRFSRRVRVAGDQSPKPVFYAGTKQGTYIKTENRGGLLVVSEHDADGKELRTWAAKDSTVRWIGSLEAGWTTNTGWEYSRAEAHGVDRMVIFADSIKDQHTDTSQIFGYTFVTTNGGITWQTNPGPIARTVLNSAWQSASKAAVELWFRKYLAITTDSARTWQQAPYPTEYSEFTLVGVTRDSSAYLALGTRDDDSTRELVRSTDGITWDVLLTKVPAGRHVVKDGSLVCILGAQRNHSILLPDDASSALLLDMGPSDGSDADPEGFSCFVDDALVSIRGLTDVHVSRDTGRSFSSRLEDRFLLHMAAVRSGVNDNVFSAGDYVYIANSRGDFYNGPIDSVTTGVEEQADVFSYPPYPNPFSVSTTIAITWFWTVSPQTLTLKVYNQLGEEVRDLTSQLHSRVRSYSSSAVMDAADLSNGIYYVVCRGPNGTSTQTVVLSR